MPARPTLCSMLSWSLAAIAGACTATTAERPAPPGEVEASPPAVAPAPEQAGTRHAIDVRKTVAGTHHTNVYSEDTRASLVLELADDGSLSACRGLRSLSNHHTDRGSERRESREQQGYRGRWRDIEGGLELDLEPDDRVCAPLRRYVDLAPQPWHLRCLRAVPREGLARPMLACELTHRASLQFDEAYGLELGGIVAQPRILLGPGDGLAITWAADQVVPPEDAPQVTIVPPSRRIEPDTWAQP